MCFEPRFPYHIHVRAPSVSHTCVAHTSVFLCSCLPPLLPSPHARLEGNGAGCLGVFPLIDEACRLPRATYQVGWGGVLVLPGWSKPAVLSIEKNCMPWAGHMYSCVCLLAHHTPARFTPATYCIIIQPPHSTPCSPRPGPGPHAAHAAGGAAALLGAPPRAACLCCGPLRGGGGVQRGAADGQEQGEKMGGPCGGLGDSEVLGPSEAGWRASVLLARSFRVLGHTRGRGPL